MMLFPSDSSAIPAPPNPSITNPCTVLLPATIVSPLASGSALVALPSSTMIGVPENPCCDSPFRNTGTVIAGKGLAGAIVTRPEPTEKSMVLPELSVAFDCRIAARSEPGPESFVFITTKVAGAAVTLKGVVMAEVSPLLVTRIVSPLPATFTDSPENVATPLLAVAVTVPPRTAPVVLFVRASVTVPP